MTEHEIATTAVAVILASANGDVHGVAQLVGHASRADLISLTTFCARFAAGLGGYVQDTAGDPFLDALQEYAYQLARVAASSPLAP